MSATSNLTEETVEHLQQLIQVNIDSREGFEEAAEAIDDPKVQKLFRRLESERAANVEELKQIVEFSGVEAEDDGSIMAAVHRCWLEARAALNGGD
ncbi:MAG: PA2169 family four-helix-bundle protein, partial [Lacipirellulaceae bacterium]